MKKIDLHIHSNVSDGKLSPTDVVEFAHQNKLDIIALSDHDDIGGIGEASKACLKYGIKLIPAIELTCASRKDIDGFPEYLSIHILGYNIDYHNNDLIKRLAKHRKTREDKTKSIVKYLSKFGYYFKYNSIKTRSKIPMRIADIIEHIKTNFEKDESYNACIKYLEEEAFYDLLGYDFSIYEAINLIHEFGGKAVLAHPLLSYRDYQTESLNKDSLNILLDYLCKLGLDGIETNYLAFDFIQKEYLNKISTERNLVSTIGSDFHGGGKRNALIYDDCKNEEELIEKNIIKVHDDGDTL